MFVVLKNGAVDPSPKKKDFKNSFWDCCQRETR